MTTEPELSADFVSLYRRAFAEYGPRALWSMRPIDDPTPSDALAITKALRTYGGMEGRRLAENNEKALSYPSPRLQVHALRVLAAQRSPDRYVAGGGCFESHWSPLFR